MKLSAVWLYCLGVCLSAPVLSSQMLSAFSRQLIQIGALSDRDPVAALAETRQLQANPELQTSPDQLAELRATECFLVLNDSSKQAQEIAEQALAQPNLPARALVPLQNCLGNALEWTGHPDLARAHYDIALTAARGDGEALLIADSLGIFADYESYKGDYVSAAGRLREALALTEQALAALPKTVQADPEAPEQVAVLRVKRAILQKLGHLSMRMDDSEKAMTYFQPLLDEAIKLQLTQSQIISYYNIGRAQEESGHLDAAWAAQKKSLELAEATGDKVSVAWSQRCLGAIRVLQERYDQAAPYIEKALLAFETMDDADIIAQLHFYRARIHRHNGHSSLAEADLQAAIATFRQNQTWRFLDKALTDLAQLRQQAGALTEALQLLQERDQVHRQLDQQIQDRAAARLQAEFDNEAQARENRRLAELQTFQSAQLRDAEKLATQQYLIIALASVIAAIIAFFAVRQLRIARQMRTMALTDELTKVPNRRAIYAQAEQHWQNGTEPLSLLIMDIDHFKRINDQFGHSAGDKALQMVAQRCQKQLRQGDAIGRVGGEEFMVILPKASVEVAADVAERLRLAILQAPANEIAAELTLAISIGVATRSNTDLQLQGLINRADTALYRAKAGGRNRVECDVLAPAEPAVPLLDLPSSAS